MQLASLSGGWDSSVLWLFLTGYLKDGHSQRWILPDAQAAFVDPGREHPSTYAMLDTLDAMTDRPIHRLHGPTWEEALEAHSYFLPWHRARWCTPTFKIWPFEAFVKDLSSVISYIGLRADEEHRKGYLGQKSTNITPAYPLREMGITFADREYLAGRAGLPKPAPWSCDCCPLKPHILWVELVEQFPDRAEWAAQVEEEKERRGGSGFGWMRKHKIRDLINNPQTRSDIRRNWYARNIPASQLSLWDDLDDDQTPCIMCRVK